MEISAYYVTNKENKAADITIKSWAREGKHQWGTNKLTPVYHQRKSMGKSQAMPQRPKKEAYYFKTGQ